MAKFEIGELCLDVTDSTTNTQFVAKYGTIIEVTILSLPGRDRAASRPGWNGSDWVPACNYEAMLPDGTSVGMPEYCLRKRPPDNHADATEDPGLTRLKRALQQDQTHKQPIKEKQT